MVQNFYVFPRDFNNNLLKLRQKIPNMRSELEEIKKTVYYIANN